MIIICANLSSLKVYDHHNTIFFAHLPMAFGESYLQSYLQFLTRDLLTLEKKIKYLHLLEKGLNKHDTYKYDTCKHNITQVFATYVKMISFEIKFFSSWTPF